MTDLNRITRRFIMGESRKVSSGAVIQALIEIVGSLRPKTITEKNKVAMAARHLKEIKYSFRRLEETVASLEQVKMLEEISSMGAGAVEGAVSSGSKKKKKEGLIR